MSKNLKILFTALLALAVAVPAMAATVTVHGDLDNRFELYTNQATWFDNDNGNNPILFDNDTSDSFGAIKYRSWAEMATNDGAVKGVIGLEIGATRFGSSGGGGFSGDGKNFEVRWAYTDFQLPSMDTTARIRVGLFTNVVNKHFWAETAMGVKFYTDNWYVAWLRGVDSETGVNSTTGDSESWHDGDLDSLIFRYDLKAEPVKAGFWAVYFMGDTSDDFVDITSLDNPFVSYEVKKLPKSNFDMIALGVDGSWSTATNQGKLFINWDAIYESGTLEDASVDGGTTREDIDITGYFIHADIGLNFGKSTLTFTSYYASGDDPTEDDNDSDAFMQVDVDANYSIIFQEGVATNDNYFSERHTFGSVGMFLNKLDYNYAVDKKTKIGAAVLYLLTAEESVWDSSAQNGGATNSDDSLGIEFQLYASHKLYDNLQLAWNFAYLAADDAMDQFETDKTRNGSADVDVFTSTARIRYQF